MCVFCRSTADRDPNHRFGTCSWTGQFTILVTHHIKGRKHKDVDNISPEIHALWHSKFIDPPSSEDDQEKYAVLYALVRSTFRLIYRDKHHVLCTWLLTMEKLGLCYLVCKLFIS